MDFSTHVLTATFAAAGLGRGRSDAPLVGAAVFLGAMAPDVDALLYLIGPALYFRHHRVYTHTLLAALCLSALIAGGVTLITPQARFRALFAYAFLGHLVHLALDMLPRYPLRPLAPFAGTNLAMGIVPFHDPTVKLIGLLGIVATLMLPFHLARPGAALFGLLLLVRALAAWPRS